MKKSELGVPVPKRYGWMLVLGTFLLLAISGLTLSLLYRDMPKRSDVIAKERTKNAKHVVYAIVFSTVPSVAADSIVRDLRSIIGTDTAHTDLVIGSTVVDPWCASVDEFERNLHRALRETKQIDVGKQTMIVSMVTGLLVKSKIPASVVFIGTLHPNKQNDFAKRTLESIQGMEVRHGLMAPISTYFYLRPASDDANAAYIGLFRERAFSISVR